MATSSTSCFPNDPQPGQPSHMYGGRDDPHQYVLSSTTFDSSSGLDTPSTSLLYNLSLLKEKLTQIQSLVIMCISPNHHSQTTPQSTVIAMANIGTLLQEIIIAASSMMFTCQQVSLGQTSSGKITNTTHESLLDRLPNNEGLLSPTQANYIETLDWFDQGYGNNVPATCNTSKRNCEGESIMVENSHERLSSKGYDIVEMDAADLLAKYTHYCQICGKGFKRDANLRMHMRAHGDEYKSNAALTNPMKKNSTNGNGGGEELSTDMPRKYSCPQEGCRWNKKHVKFQPLKSMICVKNHYKRSHCPKMYVCKRCNRKQFSVLSDLRTHEKHCGDLKWQCSCGTTFSRKDKLMGHVGLFVGHVPVEVGSGIARSRNIKIG